MMKLWFPSPVGELHFSINRMEFDCTKEGKKFPSPVGELHFSIKGKVAVLACGYQFPSPVGELHFSIPSLQSRHQSGLMVGIAWEKYFWKNK